ncbi:MAG: hypothetical protein WCY41_03395, partial [Candidatus Micrarchaeia archaeon]
MAQFNFLLIAGSVIVLYAVSWLLARQGKHLSVMLHRKIWNGVLILSFVGMGIFSMLKALRADLGISVLPDFINVGFWHVEFGIVCVIVAAFHALWHIPYFKQYLPKGKPKAQEAAPVAPA